MSSARVLLLGILSAAAALPACGPSAPACSTDCPKVAGRYVATLDAVDASRSSCRNLYYAGASDEVVVAQSDADLSTSLWNMSGTVDSKLNVLLPSTSVLIRQDGMSSSSGEPGTVGLVGTFYGEEGARSFVGRFNFTRTRDACALQVSTRWTQVGL